MKNKRFAIVLDTERCIDCKACTVACKAENNVPLGPDNYRNWVETGRLRGTYPNLGQSFIPSQCQHCGNAPCEHVCPTRATTTNPDGSFSFDIDELSPGPYQVRVRSPGDFTHWPAGSTDTFEVR